MLIANRPMLKIIALALLLFPAMLAAQSVITIAAQPSVQVGLFSAYQLYFNGVQIGAEGNLDNGNSSLNAIQSYWLCAHCRHLHV